MVLAERRTVVSKISQQLNLARCRRLIGEAIAVFDLDLTHQIVLTEAATGYYMLTPLIAALAGAERVYALTKDSRFGLANDVRVQTMDLAREWRVSSSIEVLSSRTDTCIGLADIVTNLGFVRPLDGPFLHRLKDTAVISLMWETWEFRPEDLDLIECRRLKIPVLGTNEHYEGLDIFHYVGHLALKLLLELDIELFQSRVVVLGSGEFADVACRSLVATGTTVAQYDPTVKGMMSSLDLRHALQKADALLVIEHHIRDMLISNAGALTAKEIHSLNPGIVVAHICGGVNPKALIEAEIRYYPQHIAAAGYMSVATDYLGPRPLIFLHTAGLKVGEELARARQNGLDAKQAELQTLARTTLAQGFAGYHFE